VDKVNRYGAGRRHSGQAGMTTSMFSIGKPEERKKMRGLLPENEKYSMNEDNFNSLSSFDTETK
jgi:hypothetical protein